MKTFMFSFSLKKGNKYVMYVISILLCIIELISGWYSNILVAIVVSTVKKN